MQLRTTDTIITFRNRFSVGNAIVDQPAGSYRSVREEMLIEGLPFPVYQLVSTVLQLPAIGIPSLSEQHVSVTAADLRDAMDADVVAPKDDEVAGASISMAERARNFGANSGDD